MLDAYCPDGVQSVEWDANSAKVLAGGADRAGSDRRVKVFDVASQLEVSHFTGHGSTSSMFLPHTCP